MESKVHILNNVIYKDSVYGDIIKIFYVLDDIQFGIGSDKSKRPATPHNLVATISLKSFKKLN